MKAIRHSFKLQRGVASLLTAVVLLTCITLVALFTSKTVVMETKMAADDYRTSQATAAAQAAMDQAVAYYGVSNTLDRFDNNNTTPFAVTTTAGADGILDYSITSPMTITLTSGSQTTRGQFYFNNTTGNICNSPTGNKMDKGMLVATGWSDDNTAVRTITQCVNKAKILNDDGPAQPFITHGGIGIAGNATFINRFTNSNVWTGGSLGSAGAAFATYLRPANKQFSDLTWAEKIAGCANPCDPDTASNNVRLVSNTKAGYGVDVIGDDPTLGNLTADETFAMFFADTRAATKSSASDDGQMYTNIVDATDKGGTIWIEGSGSAPNIGSPDNPAILVVNGDLTIGSNATIYGVVYVIGTLTINGSPNIYGSLISESGTTAGNGSPTLVFVPWFGGDSSSEQPGDPAPISGSWKDW